VCRWRLKYFQKIIHCGQLLIVLEDRSWKSLWEMNTFHSQYQRFALDFSKNLFYFNMLQKYILKYMCGYNNKKK
jgi:hypothetical protein